MGAPGHPAGLLAPGGQAEAGADGRVAGGDQAGGEAMSGNPQIKARTQALLPAVRQMIAAGMSQREMSVALCVSKNIISGICARWVADEWAGRPVKRQGPVRGGPPKAHRRPSPESVVVPLLPVLPSVAPPRTCQWPGEPWARPWPFCGARLPPGSGPYCEEHRARAFAGRARVIAA